MDLVAFLIVLRLSFYTTDGLEMYDGRYITRSGRELSATSVAVDPELLGWDLSEWYMVLPSMEVVGLPVLRTIDDTGGKVKGPIVDVYLPKGDWKEIMQILAGDSYYVYVVAFVTNSKQLALEFLEINSFKPRIDSNRLIFYQKGVDLGATSAFPIETYGNQAQCRNIRESQLGARRINEKAAWIDLQGAWKRSRNYSMVPIWR